MNNLLIWQYFTPFFVLTYNYRMTAIDKSSLGEFDLIGKYFTRKGSSVGSNVGSNILLGVGDDCALLRPPSLGNNLAITTDMLVEDRHFFTDVDPFYLGHKALAVNLSDLAAMGAKPLAFTLALSLPTRRVTQPGWLDQFSKGLFKLADAHDCPLIGGDTTSGPLTLSITAFGEVPQDQALRRDLAKEGDDIWVSHELGDARWALGYLRGEWSAPQNEFEVARTRLELPTPRIELGQGLRKIAHAAIDISDGLLGDLRHILKASNLNASVWIDQVPCSKGLMSQSTELRRLCTLRGGDDYELCFTASVNEREPIERLGTSLGLKLTRIGKTTAASKDSGRIDLYDANNHLLDPALTSQYLKSFDHFK